LRILNFDGRQIDCLSYKTQQARLVVALVEAGETAAAKTRLVNPYPIAD
jgi:hypothetical protein